MTTFEGLHALDALSGLKRLPNDSVDCVVTSPPYWDMRDYGPISTKWGGGERCALGRERGIDQYLVHLLEVFDEIQRVLKPTGTIWVNLFDVYWSGSRCVSKGTTILRHSSSDPITESSSISESQSFKGTMAPHTLTPPYKSLCLVPERFTMAMVARGWILRNRIVWHKPNHLPASVKDRLACSWEYLFLFTKSPSYSFDLDAIRVPRRSRPAAVSPVNCPRLSKALRGRRLPPRPGDAQSFHPKGKNPGDCWMIPSSSAGSGHPAVFPEQLCERPILAGCPKGGLVLDPFLGSGTTAVVAKRLGRRCIGFDSNPAYIRLAKTKLSKVSENETTPA